MLRGQNAWCWLMFAGVVIGCGPSTKDAGPATPKQAAPEVSVSDNPQVARVIPLLDDFANVVKTSAEEVSKIADNDSALAAGKKLKKDADRIRELAKELKSVGKIKKDPKLSASYLAYSKAGLEWAKAGVEWGKISASGKLSAEAVKAVGEGLQEFNNAMLEMNKAVAGD